ncbi:MAG TPA: hypothetical protein VFA57_06520, partial [Pseudolabrys sp.]|nr:hypothetical protein [Pseudolabrys sp.]
MFSKTTRSLRIHLVILNLLVLAPLLISGLIIAAMYVASERQALVSQAQDVLRNVRFSVNKELQRYALSLDGLTKSARLDQGAFEELYKSAQILTETIPGSRISLEKAGGEPIFNTFRQFGSNLPSRTAPSLLAAEEAAIRTRQL